MLGDTAYDGDGLRQELDQRGTKPVIPNHPNRKQLSFNKRLYKLRWRIERAFNRLKDFRRIATRSTDWRATIWLPSAWQPRSHRDLMSLDPSERDYLMAASFRRISIRSTVSGVSCRLIPRIAPLAQAIGEPDQLLLAFWRRWKGSR